MPVRHSLIDHMNFIIFSTKDEAKESSSAITSLKKGNLT
jgi:hypothetical protein